MFHGPDLCCREHDQCPQTISPLQFNYGIRNFRFHTISHCDCDARLAAGREGLGLRGQSRVTQSWVSALEIQMILKIRSKGPFLSRLPSVQVGKTEAPQNE